jgi:integrase
LYGAGLRLLECLRLRVKDIDFNANHIVARYDHVRALGLTDRIVASQTSI